MKELAKTISIILCCVLISMSKTAYGQRVRVVTFDPPKAAMLQTIGEASEHLYAISVPISKKFECNPNDVGEIEIRLNFEPNVCKINRLVPDTQLRTDVLTSIAERNSSDSQQTIDVGLGTQVGIRIGPVEIGANATRQSNETTGSHRTMSMERLPPLETVIVTGTEGTQSIAFFKFRPHTQTTLEGTTNVAVVFSADAKWKPSFVVLECVALDKSRTRTLGSHCSLVHISNGRNYPESLNSAIGVMRRGGTNMGSLLPLFETMEQENLGWCVDRFHERLFSSDQLAGVYEARQSVYAIRDSSNTLKMQLERDGTWSNAGKKGTWKIIPGSVRLGSCYGIELTTTHQPGIFSGWRELTPNPKCTWYIWEYFRSDTVDHISATAYLVDPLLKSRAESNPDFTKTLIESELDKIRSLEYLHEIR